MSIVNFLLILISLIILPILAGAGLGRLLRVRGTLSGSILMGYLLTWTVIQLFSVPVTLMKGSFRLIAWSCLAVLIIAAVFFIISSLTAKTEKNVSMIRGTVSGFGKCVSNRFTLVLFLIFIVLSAFIFYKIIRYYHLDADDTRYVINAVDILRTDSILQTDPTSGTPLQLAYGDFYKDLVSSWSVFLAYTGFVTGVSPTIAAHSVMHVILYILILSVYWRLSLMLFANKDGDETRQNRIVFMYFVQLIILFGYYSLQSSETFILTRLWQGKSVVAGLGIPLIIYLFMNIYDDPKKKAYWILILLTAVSMCHMSAMGIVISAVMIAAFGLYTTIAKKKIWICILAFICCIPSGVYFLISQMTDYFKYIQN